MQFSFQVKENAKIRLIMPNNPIVIEEGRVQSNPFTVEFDKNILHLGSADIQFSITVKNLATGHEWHNEQKVHLIGPF